MASSTPFTYKTFPVFPGAFMIDDGAGSVPIFCSIYNYTEFGFNNVDNYYLVMPGYKLETFDSTYGTIRNTHDNQTGTQPKYFTSTNQNNGSSCKLYFKDVEIIVTGISDGTIDNQTSITLSATTVSWTTTSTLLTQIPTNIPYIYKMSSYPGAYLLNGVGGFPIFCSIKDFSASKGMNNIDNYYIVMPGYTLIIFSNANYDGGTGSNTFYNTLSVVSYVKAPSTNNGSSCRLYFGSKSNDTEIKINEIS